MPESTKQGATGLPEGSDIGLGPGDRAFEPHYSDQNPSEIVDFRGIFLFFVYCGADFALFHSKAIHSISMGASLCSFKSVLLSF